MASGTINNLQQALNCASKCDCCEKLQQQLNQLKNQVGGLDRDIKNIIPRVNQHETRISKNEKDIRFKSTNNSNNNSSRDIQKLKQQISAIERYINSLDNAGKQITSVVKKFVKIFSIF